MPNQRRSLRYPIRLRVLFRRRGIAHFLEAETENVSVDGAFVATRRRPLEIGTRLLVVFETPNGDEILLRGQVTWVRDGDDPERGFSRGMGIHFDDDADEERLQLQALLLARSRAGERDREQG